MIYRHKARGDSGSAGTEIERKIKSFYDISNRQSCVLRKWKQKLYKKRCGVTVEGGMFLWKTGY